jgi:hypothetical protein
MKEHRATRSALMERRQQLAQNDESGWNCGASDMVYPCFASTTCVAFGNDVCLVH